MAHLSTMDPQNGLPSFYGLYKSLLSYLLVMRRGTYISKCRRIFLWTNEQDHMRVFVHFPTAASLSEPLALLQATLTALEV